ncbi:hypothetical protein SELMODRAFT_411195 [Selaginella moellendorffii]|uniref:Uncharacterized protein n=1 Tax=Selaginella moellendorffii TaxID=88036 RepID=D8RGV7_SELML|nr:hypothetical protein SELMODRAFT_411195 [Selaginella moellendorffii]
MKRGREDEKLGITSRSRLQERARNPFINIVSITAENKGEQQTIDKFDTGFVPGYAQFLFGEGCRGDRQGHSVLASLFFGLCDVIQTTATKIARVLDLQEDFQRHSGTKRGSQDSQKSENGGPDLGDGETGWGFCDLGFYVEGQAPRTKEPLTSFQEFDPQKLVLQEMTRNLFAGHRTPVYDLVLCSDMWTYGKLEVRGLIAMRNDEVDKDSFAQFQLMEKNLNYPVESLDAQLKKRIAYNEKRFKKPIVYPDSDSLVGNLFVSPEGSPSLSIVAARLVLVAPRWTDLTKAVF